MEIFMYQIIKSSIIITIAGMLLVALTSMFLEKYTVRLRYILWLILFIVLIIPFNIPSGHIFSFDISNSILQNEVNNNSIIIDNAVTNNAVTNNAVTNTYTVDKNNASLNNEAIHTDENVNSNENLDVTNRVNNNKDTVSQEKASIKVIDILFAIWTVGVVVSILYNICGYGIFLHKLRKNRVGKTDDNILNQFESTKKMLCIVSDIELEVNNYVTGPIIVGLFKKRYIYQTRNMMKMFLIWSCVMS